MIEPAFPLLEIVAAETGAEFEHGERWFMIRGDMAQILLHRCFPGVDHLITDPPYSEHVHKSVRSSKRNDMADRDTFPCRTRRTVDLGFEHLAPEQRNQLAEFAASHVSRWTLVFSDVESCHEWRRSLEATGLDYVRTGIWERIGGSPQFTGDRPAAGFEAVTMCSAPEVEAFTLCHRCGRKRWNGGGHAAVYRFPVVANRKGVEDPRCHTTQKPEELMRKLVLQFSDVGDLICDPFTGSGTTGAAAVKFERRFIGIERDPEHFATACERLRAAELGRISVRAHKRSQNALFDLPPPAK